MDAPKYRAFISYSHRDSDWASWLHGSLEKYHLPKPLIGTVTSHGEVPKRIAPIFRDRDELPSATDLGSLINAALAGSECQIVICSPQAAKSKWVNEEILAFKRLGREDRIFCLIVGGEPNATDMPGREAEECFPPALRFRLGADGELGMARTEPIAADARPGKDGKNNAKLKVISGLLGVGFDTLKRREQQRRNRRMFAFSCAAMAGMVLTSGLAAFALIQRAAAQRQTVRAEAETRTAQETTRFLVDLFKISDPSEARGNTVTAREMLDKGASKIEVELARQPAIQARLMDTLGSVYMGLGLFNQARPLIDRALTTRERLPAVEPATIADTLIHRGELLMWQGDYPASEADYRKVIALENRQPAERGNQEVLARAEYGLGIVLGYRGNYAEARTRFESALARQKALFGEENDETARTMKELADLLDRAGDHNTAIGLMQTAVRVQKKIHGGDPHPALYEAINDLGLLLYGEQRYDEAEAMILEALAMAKRLYGDKHTEVTHGLTSYAYILQTRGELERSEATYREVLAMQRSMLGDVHPEIAFTLGSLAFVQYDRGDTRGGLATLQQSLRMYQRLFPGDHPEVARAMNRVGFWLTLAGDYAGAVHELRAALEMRRRVLGNSHPDVGTSLMNMAILEVATGKFTEAERSGREAREIFTATLAPSHWLIGVAESAEGAALTGLGDYPQAEQLLSHGYGMLSADRTATAAYRTLAKRYLDALHQSERRGMPNHRASPSTAARAAAPAARRPASASVVPAL
jgi:tetratricopeptide (TPR) repeat protein